MDAITSTLLAGLIIVIGRIVQGKGMEARVIIGIVMCALMLSLLGQADAGLGSAFAALVLISAVFVYGLPIIQKLGYTP